MIKGNIKKPRFTNQVCCSLISEEYAHRYFGNGDGGSLTDIEEIHSKCYSSDYKRNRSSKYRINLLHTCRQIYNEARFLPYSTNTFCFNTSRNLRAFIHLLNQGGVNVNEAVRSLRIDLAHVSHDVHGWTQAYKAVAQRMTLLETISVNVNRGLGSQAKGEAIRLALDCIAMMGKIPVQSTTIFAGDLGTSSISDSSLEEHHAGISRRWSLREKVKKSEWVEKVKLAVPDLLD